MGGGVYMGDPSLSFLRRRRRRRRKKSIISSGLVSVGILGDDEGCPISTKVVYSDRKYPCLLVHVPSDHPVTLLSLREMTGAQYAKIDLEPFTPIQVAEMKTPSDSFSSHLLVSTPSDTPVSLHLLVEKRSNAHSITFKGRNTVIPGHSALHWAVASLLVSRTFIGVTFITLGPLRMQCFITRVRVMACITLVK